MSRRTTDPSELGRENRDKAARLYRTRQDLRAVLSSEQGRRVIQWIIEEGGIFRSPPIGSAETMVVIGEQRFALRIRATVKDLDPALLSQMEQEYAAPAKLPGVTDDPNGGGNTGRTETEIDAE